MGVGKYNTNPNDDDYDDDNSVSLWSHATAFRWLVCVAGLLLVMIIYGFYEYHRAVMTAMAHGQRLHSVMNQANSTNNSNNQVTPVAPTVAVNLKDSLENYPLATNWFASKLNPNRTAPASGFDAYYFNTQDPNYTIILKENRRDILVDYAYDDFHGIPSQNFGGYWIGRISAPYDGTYELEGSGHGRARVLINGRIVAESKGTTFPDQSIYLKKGEYVLEIEYENTWFTTNVNARFGVPVKTYDVETGELSAALSTIGLPHNTPLYAVSLYDSSHDNTININSAIPDPYVLMVSSYELINWNVYGTTPRAIIYMGAGQVAAVGSPPIFKANYSLDSRLFNATAKCSCGNGMFHCDNYTDWSTLIPKVRNWTGLTLVGGSSDDKGGSVSLPDIHITPAFTEYYQNDYTRRAQQCAVPHLSANPTASQSGKPF